MAAHLFLYIVQAPMEREQYYLLKSGSHSQRACIYGIMENLPSLCLGEIPDFEGWTHFMEDLIGEYPYAYATIDYSLLADVGKQDISVLEFLEDFMGSDCFLYTW